MDCLVTTEQGVRTPQSGEPLILADGRRFVFATIENDLRGWWFTAFAHDGRSTLQGNTLMGKIAMEGCVGGGVSGTINGSEISLSISDLTKPLVTFEKPVLMGGVVTLRR